MMLKRKLIGGILAAGMLLCSFSACSGGSANELEWKDLTWGVGGPLPAASDFVGSLPEGMEVRYAKDYEFPTVGDYELELIVTDSLGWETHVTVKFSLVIDAEEPEILGATDLVSYVGEGISYRSGVGVRDNCHGKVTLEVDSSEVDVHTAGEYPVTYTAIDACGNRTQVTVHAYVYEERIDEDELYAILDPVIAREIPQGASREQQVRAVYAYVSDHITYTATSDKGDWVRAAYDGLRKGEGDCYTYFALSKAFFSRLGLKNMDIQRTPGIVEEKHYWNYVNIGTEASPRWYHFDATPIRNAEHSGCLLTDTQLRAFHEMREDENGVSEYFYAYDASKYPASDTKIVTPTPSLEEYY